MPLLLAVFSPLVVTYLSRLFENRLIISIALACIAGSFLMIGPSKVLGIGPNLTIMCFGLVFMGFFAGTALIPLYPDLLEYCYMEFGDSKQNVDMVSGIYAAGLSFGHLFGPFMGSGFTKLYGFNGCCDRIALIMISVAVIYFFFTYDSTMFKRKPKHSITHIK